MRLNNTHSRQRQRMLTKLKSFAKSVLLNKRLPELIKLAQIVEGAADDANVVTDESSEDGDSVDNHHDKGGENLDITDNWKSSLTRACKTSEEAFECLFNQIVSKAQKEDARRRGSAASSSSKQPTKGPAGNTRRGQGGDEAVDGENNDDDEDEDDDDDDVESDGQLYFTYNYWLSVPYCLLLPSQMKLSLPNTRLYNCH